VSLDKEVGSLKEPTGKSVSASIKNSPRGKDAVSNNPRKGDSWKESYGNQYKHIGTEQRSFALGILTNVG
jgi:hypothetical protein